MLKHEKIKMRRSNEGGAVDVRGKDNFGAAGRLATGEGAHRLGSLLRRLGEGRTR